MTHINSFDPYKDLVLMRWQVLIPFYRTEMQKSQDVTKVTPPVRGTATFFLMTFNMPPLNFTVILYMLQLEMTRYPTFCHSQGQTLQNAQARWPSLWRLRLGGV